MRVPVPDSNKDFDRHCAIAPTAINNGMPAVAQPNAKGVVGDHMWDHLFVLLLLLAIKWDNVLLQIHLLSPSLTPHAKMFARYLRRMQKFVLPPFDKLPSVMKELTV